MKENVYSSKKQERKYALVKHWLKVLLFNALVFPQQSRFYVVGLQKVIYILLMSAYTITEWTYYKPFSCKLKRDCCLILLI